MNAHAHAYYCWLNFVFSNKIPPNLEKRFEVSLDQWEELGVNIDNAIAKLNAKENPKD